MCCLWSHNHCQDYAVTCCTCWPKCTAQHSTAKLSTAPQGFAIWMIMQYAGILRASHARGTSVQLWISLITWVSESSESSMWSWLQYKLGTVQYGGCEGNLAWCQLLIQPKCSNLCTHDLAYLKVICEIESSLNGALHNVSTAIIPFIAPHGKAMPMDGDTISGTWKICWNVVEHIHLLQTWNFAALAYGTCWKDMWAALIGLMQE